jgi:hypothetical protein
MPKNFPGSGGELDALLRFDLLDHFDRAFNRRHFSWYQLHSNCNDVTGPVFFASFFFMELSSIKTNMRIVFVRYAGVIWLHFFTRHLYLISVWLCEDQRTYTIQTHVKRGWTTVSNFYQLLHTQ